MLNHNGWTLSLQVNLRMQGRPLPMLLANMDHLQWTTSTTMVGSPLRRMEWQPVTMQPQWSSIWASMAHHLLFPEAWRPQARQANMDHKFKATWELLVVHWCTRWPCNTRCHVSNACKARHHPDHQWDMTISMARPCIDSSTYMAELRMGWKRIRPAFPRNHPLLLPECLHRQPMTSSSSSSSSMVQASFPTMAHAWMQKEAHQCSVLSTSLTAWLVAWMLEDPLFTKWHHTEYEVTCIAPGSSLAMVHS
mmetsp:Transcript_37266/g.68171  ORF Transcript_37266/g.68171 Transcript_37266/m.68171 type:complete len:250 (-) Transcript_37266:485-1234(-)